MTRYPPQQIVQKLRQTDVELGKGKMPEFRRERGGCGCQQGAGAPFGRAD